MVVVHVLNSILKGGVGSMVRALVLEQYRKGKQPVVVCKQTEKVAFGKWCDDKGISVPFYSIEAYRSKRMTIFGGLSTKVEKQIQNDYKNECIIYHFHNPIACGVFFNCKGKSICTIHGFIGESLNRKISNFIAECTIKRLLKSEVKIVGCCNAVANYCNFKYNTNRISAVLNGVDKIEKEDRQYIKKDGKCHIGYVATIDELKGWRVLEEAYEKLPQNQKEKCELYFAGEIAPADRDDFLNFASQKNVNYLGLVEDAGKTFIPFLDVLVLPSRTEGLPMSILEAMQARVIPIATKVGGIPELIENKISGFLIDRNANELVEIFKQILSDKSFLECVKCGAQKRFKQVGTAEEMEKRYCEFYAQL